jgi:FtsP/CotA-like multicopper oxidase with cupredoxin domain
LDDVPEIQEAKAWKDTVNVPMGESVRVRIPFQDFPGRMSYHCHILDHEDLGMMAVVEIRARGVRLHDTSTHPCC